MGTSIRLVVGLGNPGREHDATRHNAGFWFADALAAQERASFATEAKFHGQVARAGDVRLLKPGTYMNLSGRSVAALARFFAIEPAEILVKSKTREAAASRVLEANGCCPRSPSCSDG